MLGDCGAGYLGTLQVLLESCDGAVEKPAVRYQKMQMRYLRLPR